MSTKQAYAVEGQPRIVQVTRIDGYVPDDVPAFRAIWDESAESYRLETGMVDGSWKEYGGESDVYRAISWALHRGIERIELTGKFQI
jgi:hypothetical protein